MTKKQINKILELHEKWLKYDLRCADLKGADLKGADLQGANLQDVDLQGSNLQGADLDFSVINLSCTDLGIHLDDGLLIQRLYHLLYNAKFSKHTSQRLKDLLLTKELIELANEFHRVKECGEINND